MARDSLDSINAPEVTAKDMLKAMGAYIWPKDDEATKRRVLISLGLLGGGKVLNVCVPFLFKAAVDNLGALSMETAPQAAMAATASIIIGCKWIFGTLRSRFYFNFSFLF
jgi:hypothetical protein